MPLLGQVGSRSTLRDGIKRLQELRVSCGKDAGGGNLPTETNDPFTDRAQWFQYHAEECRNAITERSATAGAKTSEGITDQARAHNVVLSSLDKMRTNVELLEKMLSETQNKAFKARERNKAPEKIRELEATAGKRREVVRHAANVYDELKALARRTQIELQSGTATDGSTRSGKSRVRAQMEYLRRAQQVQVDPGVAQTDRATDGREPYEEGGQIVSLKDDREYAQQYRVLEAQRQAIDQGLDRLQDAVLRIRHQAVTIGEELERQNAMLEATQERIAQQAKNVKQLNKSVDGVLKKQGPMNLCVNVFCFIVLLALVGYFLLKFHVV
jgi:peptidoglycan hydrolase CwlO-like protein